MTRSRNLIAIAVLLGLGLYGLFARSARDDTIASGGSDAGRARQSSPGPERAELATIAEMRRELTQIRGQLWEQEQRLMVMDHTNPPVPPRPDAASQAEQEHRRRDYIVGVDAAFQNEARDPQWSAAMTSMVRATLAADNDLRVGDVECRSKTCRVEIADDRSGRLGKILPAFALRLGESLPRVTADEVEDATGGTRLVLYMSRHIEVASEP